MRYHANAASYIIQIWTRCYKSCKSAKDGVGKNIKTHVDAFTVPSVIEDFFEPLIGHARAARLSREERTNCRSERLDSVSESSPAAAVASPKHFWVKRQISYEIECLTPRKSTLKISKSLLNRTFSVFKASKRPCKGKRRSERGAWERRN